MTEIVPYQNYQKIVSYGRSPEVMQSFSLILGREAHHYVQSAITAVQANDRLLLCTPQSIFRSALRAATLRLSCDPALGHAWLVPYKNNSKDGIFEAQFQAGWKGVQHMALRTGKYRFINVASIYEGEDVVEDRISGTLTIEGTLTSPKKEKGLIASFALLSGYSKSIYMTIEELDAHGRKYSKSYGKYDSIWTTNKSAAYHKTILLKLLRTYGYLDPSDAAILDDEQTEVSDLELPDEADVTIIDSGPAKTTEEMNKLLGFDDGELNPEPAAAPEPAPAVEAADPTYTPSYMTIEEACKVTTSEGKAYGSMTIVGLEKMLSAMWKQVKTNGLTAEATAEVQRKIAAANVVLKEKKSGGMN